MRIIPAIDIIDGQCVRLEKGDYNLKKVYSEDPLEIAKQFEGAGLQFLHLVDLDGAKSGKVMHQGILEKIKSKTNLVVDYGGGIRSEIDIKSLFDSGADQINLGSIAVKLPDLVSELIVKYGKNKIILSPDVQDEKIAIHGWQESSDIHIYDFINDYKEKGAIYFVCTDIEKDGMLSGSSLELYKNMLDRFPDIKLIASGGVSSYSELDKLKDLKVDGVIIGKAIYEGRIKLENLGEYVS